MQYIFFAEIELFSANVEWSLTLNLGDQSLELKILCDRSSISRAFGSTWLVFAYT